MVVFHICQFCTGLLSRVSIGVKETFGFKTCKTLELFHSALSIYLVIPMPRYSTSKCLFSFPEPLALGPLFPFACPAGRTLFEYFQRLRFPSPR